MERHESRGASGETAPSMEETRKALEGRALRQVQATLLVEKIAALEHIEVSDKDVQERIDNLVRGAGEKGKTVREFYSRPDSRDDLRAQMIFDRTLVFLLDHAKIKEVDPEPIKVDDQAKKS
jgi:FKBP-type peptidyl-prolyl cis-trans isomerase (trigger factor)